MRIPSLLALAVVTACGGTPAAPAKVADPLLYASPFMGTGGMTFSAGSAFPGAAAPNGLVKAGPDTSGPYGEAVFLHYSGYWAGDTRIHGFSHLHLHGTGAQDGGVFGVMPVLTLAGHTKAAGYETTFDKATEVASPGYYAVTLDAGKVRAEVTATAHGAHHRWKFGVAGERWAVFDLTRILGGTITRTEATLVPAEKRAFGVVHAKGGMSGGFGGYDVYFEVRTKDAWKDHQVWTSGAPAPGEALTASGGFALAFDGDAPEVMVALSLVSAAGAQANLAAELPAFDFDGTRSKTGAAWRALLGTLVVYGGSEADRRTFYSAFHHGFLMPTQISDVDGSFFFGGRSGKAQGFRMLSDFSLWDSYRTVHPLYALVQPTLASECAAALGEMVKSIGYYPRWPLLTGEAGVMLGDPASIVVADAWLRGARDFDVDAAWKTLRSSALDPKPAGGRGCRDSFDGYYSRGYVALDEDDRSVSKTMEYAHADFALSQLGAALGHTDDAALLAERAHGYRKLFDRAFGVLRPKTKDGADKAGQLDLLSWADFAEANARQSVWMAAHDAAGLAALFGGNGQFVTALEALFTASIPETAARKENPLGAKALLYPDNYWAGNEPDIQAPFQFAQAGRPDLTQKWSAWARSNFYSAEVDGLPGNDDGGTMASWFVFAALGLYPLPGSDLWILGTPLFPRVDIAVQGGTFSIVANGVSTTALYIQSATLNGQPLATPLLHHGDLKAGGALVLEMGPSPSTWGR